jgi:ADP-ribose pyrophosphatase YjhB (NUDIX family)
MPWFGRWLRLAFQQYWRLTRGTRLAVEACVLNGAREILLTREPSSGRWHLPSTPVRDGEAAVDAVLRLLRSGIASIEVNGRPELLFFHVDPADTQVAAYLAWAAHPPASADVANGTFFPLDALPPGIDKEDGERIRRAAAHPALLQV